MSEYEVSNFRLGEAAIKIVPENKPNSAGAIAAIKIKLQFRRGKQNQINIIYNTFQTLRQFARSAGWPS